MSLNPPLTLPFNLVNGTPNDANPVDANFAALLAAINANGLTLLTSDTTFYVGPGGVDGGIPTNIAAPAATVNYVLGLLQTSYDFNGHNVTIQLLDGSYSQNVLVQGGFVGQRGPGQLTIQGNLATPTNVTVTGDPTFTVRNNALCTLQAMQLTSSSSQCLYGLSNCNVGFQNIVFGTASVSHVRARGAASITAIGNYTISGGAQAHWNCQSSLISAEQIPANGTAPPLATPTITLTGTPAFSVAFAVVNDAGQIICSAGFSGSATGVRYLVTANGVLDNRGQNNIPGSSTTAPSTGGQFV